MSGVYLGRDRSAPASPLRGHESKISGKAIGEGRLRGLPPRPAVEAGGVAEGGARPAANVLYLKSGCRGTAGRGGRWFGKGARARRVNGGGTVRAGPPASDQGHAVGSANGRKLVKLLNLARRS